MTFVSDTICSLRACAALVNTQAPETLSTVGDLDAYLAEYPFTGRRIHTQTELREVRDLRPVLEGFWAETEEQTVSRVNAVLREHSALPQLVRHDSFDWHFHAVDADRPLVARIAVEMAMAMTDVLRQGEWNRLGRCVGEGCRAVVVDLSRNRSKRYCEGGCGNRTNVAAYRARRSNGLTVIG